MGDALSSNPGYLKLRKIRAAQGIARTVAASQNKMYMSGNTLMLNINDPAFDETMERLGSEKTKNKANKFWIWNWFEAVVSSYNQLVKYICCLLFTSLL